MLKLFNSRTLKEHAGHAGHAGRTRPAATQGAMSTSFSRLVIAQYAKLSKAESKTPKTKNHICIGC